MTWRRFAAHALTCAALAAPLAGVHAAEGESAQAHDVRAWLMRIHQAASHHNFQGTFVVSAAGSVSSARIAHYCQGTSQLERSESLDGQARRVYRHDDVVTTVWPQSRLALVEQRALIAQFPALLQDGDDRIAEFYRVRPDGTERVAGREADVLTVEPRDAYRYGYRLWSDRESGLLLRADVVGAHSEVLETSAFSDVAIDVRAQPASVLQPMRKLDGYRVVQLVLTPTRLEDEGWTLRQPAPGFRQVSCVRRPMGHAAPAASAPGEPQVLQAIYSDGLTYVSVFIEPFRPDGRRRPMRASVGPTQTLMERQGDWWVTVVGDVPPATLRLFASALERAGK